MEDDAQEKFRSILIPKVDPPDFEGNIPDINRKPPTERVIELELSSRTFPDPSPDKVAQFLDTMKSTTHLIEQQSDAVQKPLVALEKQVLLLSQLVRNVSESTDLQLKELLQRGSATTSVSRELEALQNVVRTSFHTISSKFVTDSRTSIDLEEGIQGIQLNVIAIARQIEEQQQLLEHLIEDRAQLELPLNMDDRGLSQEIAEIKSNLQRLAQISHSLEKGLSAQVFAVEALNAKLSRQEKGYENIFYGVLILMLFVVISLLLWQVAQTSIN